MSTRQGKDSLGIRDKNPGNIRWLKEVTWRGQFTNDNEGFCVFRDAIYGIRAMERALLVMFHEEFYDTIRLLITRWAPPSENDTRAYILAVERDTNISADTVLDMPDDLIPICRAIVVHENGYNPYPDILYQDAFNLLKGEGQAYV